jgi:hypothetical protein
MASLRSSGAAQKLSLAADAITDLSIGTISLQPLPKAALRAMVEIVYPTDR